MTTNIKEQSIKNFTRGGQIILHNTRMFAQIISWISLSCLLIFVVASIAITFLQLSNNERYLLTQWVEAKANVKLFGKDATQEVSLPEGMRKKVLSEDIIHSERAIFTIHKAMTAIIIGIVLASLIIFLYFFIIYRYLKKHGEVQSETKQIRGDSFVKISELKKMMAQKETSDIHIAGLPMPANFEVRHILVHGTIGSGKSVFIKELLDQIKRRGDRAIIYDKGCDFIRTYYREGKDILLNPLDERTASWHLWDECRDFADFDSMAAALMPMPNGTTDPFWVNAARTIFSAAARQMQHEKDRSVFKLLKKLLTADVTVIENYLKGTEAETLVSGKTEKTAISIKSVLATSLKSLKYVKDEKDSFSIRKWLTSDNISNWLFVSSLADRHETLKPLVTLWLDIAINALMSLTPSQTRRIWIILDELPTLNKLPYLINALAETRKFGGCLVAGVQSIAQLREIYGFNGAEGISGLCNSKWFFRSPSFDTANWVSKQLGSAEVEEVREGISYGESAMRAGISISKHQTNRQIICPSDIMRLSDLEAYVRLVGGYPITKVKLAFKNREECATHFIARKINDIAFDEVDHLINDAENKVSDDKMQKEIKEQQETSIEW